MLLFLFSGIIIGFMDAGSIVPSLRTTHETGKGWDLGARRWTEGRMVHRTKGENVTMA